MRQYTRKGILVIDGGKHRDITCIVIGEMADGSKVWHEINPETREEIDDQDYLLFMVAEHSVFKEL